MSIFTYIACTDVAKADYKTHEMVILFRFTNSPILFSETISPGFLLLRVSISYSAPRDLHPRAAY